MLTGQKLADAYAATHPLALDNPGKVRGTYDGGGWIVLQGDGLLAHPDLREQYPRGWSLFHRIRSGDARKELDKRKAACYELPEARITLRQNGVDNFTVTYWKQVKAGLTYDDAALELGACIMHYMACAGRLDNREPGEL